ncbi:hypothetical protein D3C72_1860850 [compost metagenome]
MVVLRLLGNHLPQQLLHSLRVTRFFGQHGLVIHQFGVIRCERHKLALDLVGFLVKPQVTQ